MTQVDTLDLVRNDFRAFLYLVWKHLNLPDPTPVQYDIARFLQSGPNKICIQAFRGIGKSYVTSAYVLWELLRDPQKKILVVSASKKRSDNFSTFTLNLIREMDILAHLRPRDNQRQSRVEFDVAPALSDQSPSVMSLGITSQISGTRADIIVVDDVEVPNNSMTPDLREKLLEKIREFSAVLKPLESSKIIYLGTPQTEDSIYNKLPETFTTRVWPAIVPTREEAEAYTGNLAPFIVKLMENAKEGHAVDPKRFTLSELADRRAEYGKAGFSLQFMLNTRLSDSERYPLKMHDLIVSETDRDTSPLEFNWLPHPTLIVKDLHSLALPGDNFFYPKATSDVFGEYTGSVMSIDPSGRGKDETTYAVVKIINGYLVVRKAGGFVGGYDDETLKALAKVAHEERVNAVIIESNFGDGMFTQLFQPVLYQVHKCALEEVRHNIQKEKRIIDTLEPVMARHKLVFDKSVLIDDWESVQKYEAQVRPYKSLVYQMAHISYEPRALRFDDRVDALAIAVAFFTEMMARDAQEGLNRVREEAMRKELEKYMELAKGVKPKRPKWV